MVEFPYIKKVTPHFQPKGVKAFQPAMVKSWKVIERSQLMKNTLRDCFEALSTYHPPYVLEAPNSIAREKGFSDHEAFQKHAFESLHLILHISRATSGTANIIAEEIKKNKGILGNPEDQLVVPIHFAEILTALHIIYPDSLSHKKGLQVGCGYGPFIHFMKEKYGMLIKGIDLDSATCRYAKNNGIDIENGDAGEMPYPDNSFDFVISRHFLEEAYLNVFMGSLTDQLTKDSSTDLIARIFMETHRVLKPGGIFISFFEDGVREETLQASPFNEGSIYPVNNPNIPVYVLAK